MRLSLVSTMILASLAAAKEGQDHLRDLSLLQKREARDSGRVSIAENFGGSHCLDAFDISEKTIIRANDSQKLGAKFLGEKEIDTFEYCLKYCCDVTLCNVAVWDEKVGSCFLFDCGSPTDFYCVFDPNDTYMTGALEIDRHEFEATARVHKDRHESQLKALGDVDGIPLVAAVPQPASSSKKKKCGPWEFPCKSGECIPVYDTCNGIPQCADGSDEDPDSCPTTPAPPTRPAFPAPAPAAPARPRPDVDVVPKRPVNVNQWGREGERYNPQQQQSSFQHKNSGVQLNPNVQSPQSWGSSAGGGAGYPYGLQQQQQPGAAADYSNFGYGYGQNPVQNGYYNGYYQQGNPPPPIPQQQQQQPMLPSPPQGPPNPMQQQSMQQANNVNGLGDKAPAEQGNARKADPAAKKSTAPPEQTSPPPPPPPPKDAPTLAPGLSQDDVVRELLKDIKDEDFVMETPSAAIFTLVVGMSLSILFAVFMACKIRSMRRRGRKRNLASDADGDYLVNGMYL